MPDDCDDFYVGYFPLPAGHKRFLKITVPGLLVLAVVVAALVAAGQKDPGGGVWEIDKEITLEGVVSVDPYAMLQTTEAGSPRTVIVVSEGKFGAAERLAALNGKFAKIRGTILHRQGRTMMEIAAAADAVSVGDKPMTIPAAPLLGQNTLTGEVIDPKCYIGAMKPGGGKTHKACAELCIAGGIPPMLAVWGEKGEEFYLLVSADGAAINEAAAPRAGERVTLTGAVEQRGDLKVLRVEHKQLAR
jgi:hypothetical protein